MEIAQILAHGQEASYGMSGKLFLVQIINLIIFIFYIWLVFKAISRVSKVGKGVEVPIWVFAIVLLPIFGAVAALLHYPKPNRES